MNQRIQQLAEQAGAVQYQVDVQRDTYPTNLEELEKFAQLIVNQCADICMEMAAKCAGLQGDGALAQDCAEWIKKDFGVDE
jgi:uncharacterized protein YutE (UPF0331/DUF86 family)